MYIVFQAEGESLPLGVQVIVICVVIMIDSLNIYWFSKISEMDEVRMMYDKKLLYYSVHF